MGSLAFMWFICSSVLPGDEAQKACSDHLIACLQTVQELIKVSDQQRTKTMTYLREIATRWGPCLWHSAQFCRLSLLTRYAAAAGEAQGACCTSCHDQYSLWQPHDCTQPRVPIVWAL